MSSIYQGAEQKIEEFLSTLKGYQSLGKELYKLLPVGSDRIIKLGKNSLILNIPESELIGRIIQYRKPKNSLILNIPKSELIGEIIQYRMLKTEIQPGFYGLWGDDRTNDIESTTRCLRELGFDNMTNLHPYDRTSFNKNSGPDVVYLSPDLRDKGNNEVLDISETDFQALDNGPELLSQYEHSHQKILSAISNGTFSIKVLSHGDKHNYEKTVRNIFFVVKSISGNRGRLVIEDLDHLVLR